VDVVVSQEAFALAEAGGPDDEAEASSSSSSSEEGGAALPFAAFAEV
jgi:hypothetical protein